MLGSWVISSFCLLIVFVFTFLLFSVVKIRVVCLSLTCFFCWWSITMMFRLLFKVTRNRTEPSKISYLQNLYRLWWKLCAKQRVRAQSCERARSCERSKKKRRKERKRNFALERFLFCLSLLLHYWKRILFFRISASTGLFLTVLAFTFC